MYDLVFEHLLRRIPAETAHELGLHALRFAPELAKPDPRLEVHALGLTFPSPLGVAAGLDKQVRAYDGLAALGFGFVEVGTITAVPQAGNPKPRVWRLPEERALVNAMGFPNPGATAAANRLQGRDRSRIVGVNVGKSKRTSLAAAAADYRASVSLLAPHADFLVLNVSSPNTPGLRALQAVDQLAPIVAEVRKVSDLPLLVKVAPDLSDGELDAIADFGRDRLEGIVATNTTISHATGHPGGLSGAPLKARALEVLTRLHARTQGALTLVSCGGVESGRDVHDRIRAGATLVQGYTGFVYGGPLWAKRCNAELATLLNGRRVQDEVGVGARVADGAPAPHQTV